MSTALASAAALLAGASGLGLQVLLIAGSGLALGHGGAGALGLALFLSSWALGAGLAGRSVRPAGTLLLLCGSSLAVLAVPLVWLPLEAGRLALGPWARAAIVVPAIFAAGALQGVFLPLLARQRARPTAVPVLISANLAGALLGAVWIADVAVLHLGRLGAAAVAGGCALAAALLGSRVAERRAAQEVCGAAAGLAAATGAARVAGGARLDPPTGPALISNAAAAWIVGLGTAWMATLEWVGLRLGVLWLGGMQGALTAILCASLAALALSAALLPRLLPAGRAGLLLLLALALAASLWPFVAGAALSALGRALAGGGDGAAALEDLPRFVRALVLVGPALLPFGALVPLLHRMQAGESGARLGRLFLHEAWGALVGIPLAHLWLVPAYGLSAAIAGVLLLGASCAAVLIRGAPRTAPALTLVAALLAVWSALQPTPARAAPPLSNPALTLLALKEDRDFAVAVVDDGLSGERTLLTDGFRAAGTGRDYLYMRALGHLPLLLHERPRRVAVLALGTGTTAGAVALHAEVERIDVLEISRAVVELAPFFEQVHRGALSEGLPGLLDDQDGVARLTVRLGDGRQTLARAAGDWDVLTMEPLLPDSPFAVYLYTLEFYELARRALAPGGIVCQWVPPHALEPRSFDALLAAFAAAFPWSAALVAGTQVILVGAEKEPTPRAPRAPSAELAAELEQLGLEQPSGIVARCAGTLEAFRDAAGVARRRPLSDRDPWIAHLPRRRGAQLLADLPLNLGRLEALSATLPASWSAALDERGRARVAGLAALRRARAAQGWNEARLRGVEPPDGLETPELEQQRELALRQAPDEHERALFDDELLFLRQLRAGVAALREGGPQAAGAALGPLLHAASLRPERGDVHLYAALALARLGEPAADKALERALRDCPRILLTSAGRTARRLHPPPELLERLERAAAPAGAP